MNSVLWSNCDYKYARDVRASGHMTESHRRAVDLPIIPPTNKNKISGIYAIVNKINGHRYVGSAVDIRDRWRHHTYHLRKGNHHSKHLQSAWKKYGKDNFEFIILEIVDNPADLLKREQIYLDASFPEYNTIQLAGNNLGYRFSEEKKMEMSVAHTGFRHTEESKKRMSEIWTGKPRGKYSPERCAKISAFHKGKSPNENQRAALEIGHHRIPTQEERQKISDAQKGYVPTQETRAKLSEARRKRIITEETKKKTSESMKRFCALRREEKNARSSD